MILSTSSRTVILITTIVATLFAEAAPPSRTTSRGQLELNANASDATSSQVDATSLLSSSSSSSSPSTAIPSSARQSARSAAETSPIDSSDKPSRSSQTKPPNSSTSTTEATTELPDFTSTHNTSTFSCHGKVTGYYADVKLGCRVYHFCTLIEGIEGNTYQRMSYICLQGSIFDQRDLNCVRRSDLRVKCEDAEKEYDSSNRQFDANDNAPSMSDSLAASIMMNPITRFFAGR